METEETEGRHDGHGLEDDETDQGDHRGGEVIRHHLEQNIKATLETSDIVSQE